MNSKVTIVDRIASISSDEEFAAMARQVFGLQYELNAVFRQFVHGAYQTPILDLAKPAFLPVELFKHHRVATSAEHDIAFKSSATTSDDRSVHYVKDAELYQALARQHFEQVYSSLSDVVILGLLPSYVEQGESSLVFMVDHFIQRADPRSKFVLHEPEALFKTLTELNSKGQRTILFGVSYALLDFAEAHTLDFPNLTIMETGGMKGRRKELTRAELHRTIAKCFPSSPIHSEYGMTELLSQGYMTDGKRFYPPSWMRAYATEISDPMRVVEHGRRGLLAFIDLANIHSCSFIQTKDIGTVLPDGGFEVEGRLDNSDLRGCNLLYT